MNIQRLLTEPISTEQLMHNLRQRLEDMEAKANYLTIYKPDTAKETIARAEDAYAGMLMLPGTGGVKEFVGSPPCWLERRHNDNEFLWQLNRMTHWQDLLEGYSLTKDGKYAQKVVEELLDWIQVMKVPENLDEYPISYFSECNPLRALELGIRAHKTWPLVLEHLGKTPYLTEFVLEQYLEVMYRQIKALRKVSPILWPKADHNHFLMECLGILTTALYFPELKEAEEWKSFAIDGIERCARAQLTEDGGQIEGCPSYHNGCMYWFGLAVLLSKRFGFTFSEEYMALYRKNLDYSIFSMRPTGKCVPVGDSHANYLATMAGVYGYFALEDMTWLGLATNLIDMDILCKEAEKFAWRALDIHKFYEGLESLKDKEYICDMPVTFGNKKIGQAILRSDWSREALSLLMTCRSPIQNFHAHIDLLSFDFTALGKTMVCDPGIFCYRDDDDRRMFKSTEYHSTIVIDDENQFEYQGSFQYGPQKTGYIDLVEERDGYSVASGIHYNYEPVVHRRYLALVDKRFVLVLDKLSGLEKNDVKRYFHLDYTNVEVCEACTVGKDAVANLAVYTYPLQKPELLSGRLSDVNDVARPATRLQYGGTYSGEQWFVTVLMPYKNDHSEAVTICQWKEVSKGYEICCGDTYRVEIIGEDIKITKKTK